MSALMLVRTRFLALRRCTIMRTNGVDVGRNDGVDETVENPEPKMHAKRSASACGGDVVSDWFGSDPFRSIWFGSDDLPCPYNENRILMSHIRQRLWDFF